MAKILKIAIVGLLGAAIAQELRTPAKKRKWHGTVAGVVPYDFRAPTGDAVRRSWWDPEGPLVRPMAFGLGWSVNFGKLFSLLGLHPS